MADLTTLSAYKTFAGISTTNATRDASLTALITAVSEAVKRRCRTRFEAATYTGIVLTPPASDKLCLRQVPVRSITSVYLNPSANGDPAAFTSDHLLTAYEDYYLETTEEGYSRSGIVRRTRGKAWGSAGLVQGFAVGTFGLVSGLPGGLALTGGGGGLTRSVGPAPGSLKVTYAAGYLTVPEPVALAVHLAVSRLYQIRKVGVGLGSESWNAYSYSAAQVDAKAVAGVLSSPEIAGLLAAYIDPAL